MVCILPGILVSRQLTFSSSNLLLMLDYLERSTDNAASDTYVWSVYEMLGNSQNCKRKVVMEHQLMSNKQ